MEKNVDFENPVAEETTKTNAKKEKIVKVVKYAAGIGGGIILALWGCKKIKKAGFKKGFQTGASVVAIADRVKPGCEDLAQAEMGIPVREVKTGADAYVEGLRNNGARW
jgi:hypothetical protein